MGTANDYTISIQSIIRFSGYKKDINGKYILNSAGKKFGEISVGRKAMLPADVDVHDYGCRVATEMNREIRRQLVAKGEEWHDEKHRQYYVGSYLMAVLRILEARTDVHAVFVYHDKTDHLPEHCNVEIVVENEPERKSQTSHSMTQVIAYLYGILERPIQHICECDLEYSALLSKIRLELPSGGSELALPSETG